MNLRTIQEKYLAYKKGTLTEGEFRRTINKEYPHIVSQQHNMQDALGLLRSNQVIFDYVPPAQGKSLNDWTTSFQSYLAESEVKADSKKPSKDVTDLNSKSPTDVSDLDKVDLNGLIDGVYYEMSQNPKLTLEQAKKKVATNLMKNRLYYMEKIYGLEEMPSSKSDQMKPLK